MLNRSTGKSWRSLALAAVVSLSLGCTATMAAAQDAMVFAAASLKNALDEVATQYQQETGKKIVASYAASSALAKQIEQAAPADIFVSADLDWMDYVAQRNLIKPETRTNLLGNRLVLIAPKDSTAQIDMAKGMPLADKLGAGRLAVGDPAHVPAGKYAKAALESLGVWSSVEGKLAPADSVRSALALVSRGEAPLGIVYETDAKADANVKIVGTFPAASHPPVIYPMALVAASQNAHAAAFLAYLKSGNALKIFEKYGFSLPVATN